MKFILKKKTTYAFALAVDIILSLVYNTGGSTMMAGGLSSP